MIGGPRPCCPGPLPGPEFYGRIEVMANQVYLRNTVSGEAEGFDEKTAARLLKIFPEILVRVNSSKPEVLSQPYTVDSKTSKRKRIKEPAPVESGDTENPSTEVEDN